MKSYEEGGAVMERKDIDKPVSTTFSALRAFLLRIHPNYLRSLQIAITYFLISVLWIVVSDSVVDALDISLATRSMLSKTKGTFFVLISAIVIFGIVATLLQKATTTQDDIQECDIELEKSNTLFSAILESSPEIMIYAVDIRYCYTAFNNRHKYSMLRFWGKEIEVGSNVLDLISDSVRASALKATLDRSMSGEYFSDVVEYQEERQPIVYWQNNYSPILDRFGKVIGVTCFTLNITPLKRAQEQNQYISLHDQLTGLYNRQFFENMLSKMDIHSLLPITIVLGDVNGLKLVNDAFGRSFGDELLVMGARALTEIFRDSDTLARWGGDEYIILMPNTTTQEADERIAAARIRCREEHMGHIGADISFGRATLYSEGVSLQEIIKTAEDHMYQSKISESKSMRNTTIKMIMTTLHERSPLEDAHSKRVGELCRKIGTALGVPDSELSTLSLAGFLHDIGKIAIDGKILNDHECLSEKAHEKIRQHPEVGCRIIRSSYEASEVGDAILSHHERWDGKGYPNGLAGKDIPYFARIICVADSYDAMTSDRAYRKPVTNMKAVSEIIRCAGTQFDPEIAKVFVTEVLGLPWEIPAETLEPSLQ